MNLISWLYFIWSGFYGHIINYLKQGLFQGKEVFESPLDYLKDSRFVIAASSLLAVSFGTWFFDAYIRQKLHLSEMYAYSSLITAPISVITTLIVLKLSEQYLADKIVWWATILWAVGVVLSMVGATFMLRR